MNRLPCEKHTAHVFNSAEVALIVAALTAEVYDLQNCPGYEGGDMPMVCPRDALGWARDVEMYYVHATSALTAAGILWRNEDGSWV